MKAVENETPVVEEPIEKTSKLQKIKRAATIGGFYGITFGASAATMYYSYQVMKMNYETAKIRLEAMKQEAAEVQE